MVFDPNFDTTGVQSEIGLWTVSGLDKGLENYIFAPPTNPSSYESNPSREQTKTEVLDGAPVFQHPPDQKSLTRTVTYDFASETFFTGLEIFSIPDANGERPRVRIDDRGFNEASGFDAQIIDVRREYLPQILSKNNSLRFKVTFDFILV